MHRTTSVVNASGLGAETRCVRRYMRGSATTAWSIYGCSNWRLRLGAILVLALLLRLKGIHNPILDHPACRQGDTAAIARNFATLEYNLLRPQTDYNGPSPNYVDLELQIVPFLAATLYKLFVI